MASLLIDCWRELLRLRHLFLVAIIAAYLVLALLYALKIPKWNAPDEPAHYNYIRYLAEHGAFPVLQVGDYDFAYLEKLKAAKFPEAMPVDTIRYESHQPPLYYLLATPLFLTTRQLPLDQQVIVLRLLSALFGALLLITAYHIVSRLFPADELLQVAVPGFIAFIPMYIATTAAIDNDTLSNLILSLIILVSIIALQRAKWTTTVGLEQNDEGERGQANPSPLRFWLSLGLLIGLGLLTKLTSYIALPLVAFAVCSVEWPWRPLGRPLGRIVQRLAIVYGAAAVISGWWFVRNALVYGGLDLFGLRRHDLVVVGQPLTGRFDLAAAKYFLIVFFRSFWAQFGWMGILVDERIYLLLAVLSLLAGIGLLLFVLKIVQVPHLLTSFQKVSLGLLLLSFILTFGGVLQYNLTYIQAQGRYLFPAIVAIGTFFVLGLRELLAEEHRPLLFGILLLGLLGLDLLCLLRFIVPAFAS
ncbi:MAG: hypothetical protein M1136_10955 [Chloroflexi bacterium]|nr:hypothetical protein [Chloroflexota bacterium]MCL5076145.1 hypothetical protein [Chloroflexota bacterium]